MLESSFSSPQCCLPAQSSSAGAQTNRRAAATAATFPARALWPDTSGAPINAHGAGFLFHSGIYYWFGEFKTAGRGRQSANVGVSVYSSRDLYHWKNEGIALKVSDDPASDIVKGCVIERPKVLFNAKTRLYVMWFHLELKGKGYNAARAGVATSKSPTGPFTFLRDFRPDGEMSRDMTLYQDIDGKGYLITTSENNQTQHVSQLTDDYLDTTGHYTRILAHKALEGEAIFKVNGHYFYIGSHTTGWAPESCIRSRCRLNSPGHGRNSAIRAAARDAELTFGAQSTYVLPLHGSPGTSSSSPTNGDRRTPSMAAMSWLPINITGDTFTISWRNSWDLNVFDPHTPGR